MLKEVSAICAPALNDIRNNEISTQKSFRINLKRADVTHVFKKEDASLLKNYRPVSVLPVVSEIYERIIQKQILKYIDKHLSPHLCGYRKGYSTQTALISMPEKWKLSIDKKSFAGGVTCLWIQQTDFSHNMKLFFKPKNSSFSSWWELILVVPQGSVLGPLLLNIYQNDLFFFLKNVGICNFADDTTTYISGKSLENVL